MTDRLLENSPLNFHGSITLDLMASKIWICDTLRDLGLTDFSTIYILGSWYGNMAYVLAKTHIQFNKVINVDINAKWLHRSELILRGLGLADKVESMKTDANDLDYHQLDSDGLVINTSVQDIDGLDWWRHIPKNTLVVLQDRDSSRDGVRSLQEFNTLYPMRETLYLEEKHLKDPETPYRRFLKIGRK